MFEMLTVLPLPTLALLKAPVALATASESPLKIPVNPAFDSFSVATVLPSKGLLFAVMPVTALMGAGVMLAVVVVLVLDST
jgi:hypothetical protein